MASFAKVATVSASTKRPPAPLAGKRGEPVAHLPSFNCTPLDPVSATSGAWAKVEKRAGLETPLELLETFVDGADYDIREGDVLIVADREYPIRAVADWTWRGDRYLHLIVEELKR